MVIHSAVFCCLLLFQTTDIAFKAKELVSAIGLIKIRLLRLHDIVVAQKNRLICIGACIKIVGANTTSLVISIKQAFHITIYIN